MGWASCPPYTLVAGILPASTRSNWMLFYLEVPKIENKKWRRERWKKVLLKSRVFTLMFIRCQLNFKTLVERSFLVPMLCMGMQSLGLLPHCKQSVEAPARQLGILSLWLGTRTSKKHPVLPNFPLFVDTNEQCCAPTRASVVQIDEIGCKWRAFLNK